MAPKKKAKKVPESFPFEETPGAMGLAEEMRNLGQEIVNSFDARMAKLLALRQETAATLKSVRHQMKNVRHELKRKATDLRRFLHAATEFRGQAVNGMMSAFRQERQAAASHWQSMGAALAKRRASPAR